MPFSPLMAIGAGIVSAIAVFSIVFGNLLALPLFYLAPLPLYLAGFGIGGKGAMIAVMAAVITTALIGGVYAALPFAVAYGMPAVIACRQALRPMPGPGGAAVWAGPGNIAGAYTVMGVGALLFAAFTAMMDEQATPLAEMVSGFLGHALERMGAAEMPDNSRTLLIGSLAPLFPGMAVASWVMMHIVNAAAAQGAMVKSGRNLRPDVSYRSLYLPDWSSWLLVGAGLLAVATPGDWSYIGRNLVIVALVPFFLVGLSVVHAFASRVAGGTPLLVAFYVLLLVLGWASILVAVAGVIEQWVGLKNRMKPTRNEESE